MCEETKITALQIKYALMWYYRFTRQCICASECDANDVMVFNDKTVIDIEVKISKHDLWQGEAKKEKHKIYKNSTSLLVKFMPNKFYICVPVCLEEEAKRWADETNPKYGVIRYRPGCYVKWAISIAKKAKSLRCGNYPGLKQDIMRRVCAENIGLIGKMIKKEEK